MKILMLLSKEFTVDPRVYKEAKSLTASGHNITVIMWDRTGSYEKESIVEKIRVIRIYNTTLMKVLKSDLLRNPLWWRKAYKKALQLYKTDFKFDVVHCHDLDTLKTGVWLKKKLGIKLVYDAHEVFSYMIAKTVPKFFVNLASRMERKLIPYADRLITVDDGYSNYFRSITKTPKTIIRNCKDLIGEYTPPTQKKFTLTFIGTINRLRFFPEILHVVGKIKDVQLIIVARKEDNIYSEIKNLAKTYNNILFLEPIPTNKVISMTKKGHAIICMFDPSNKLNKIGSPNKLFEAMVTARPIIVTKETRAGDIVEQEKCGLSIEYERDSLKEAIMKLRDNPKLCEKLGKNGLKAAKEKYNWSNEAKKLDGLYRGLQ